MRAILFDIVHALVSKYPRWVVAVSMVAAAVAGFYGTANMQMITDQDRLLSENLDYHHRYMDFVRTFGDLEFLYVIIESPTKDEMAQFADALATRLRDSDNIEDVIYAFDTDWAADYALYFDDAKVEDLRRFQCELDKNKDEIKTLFVTRSIDEIFTKIDNALDEGSDGQEGPASIDEKSLDELRVVIDALSGKKQENFAEFLTFQDKLDELKQGERKYNWSNEGGFLLMLVMPAKDFSTLSVIEEPLKRVRADIWLTQQDFPNVKAGLTGRPALQADEMSTTNEDMMNASILALICVTVLFVGFFRELGRPLCGILALLCAMGWTYGFIALTLGHLNLLSLVFALILIGLGIDFGIHFLHRYQEELDREGDPSIAVGGALRHVGSGILTGATTSSIAFLLAMTTDFLGLAELGYVAGMGIIFCLIAMLVTLPALLITYDRHFRLKDRPPTPVHLLGLRHVSRYPAFMVIVLVAVTAALAPKIWHVRFNDNLLDLQAEGLESVEYEHKLMDDSEYSTWYCAFVKPDLESVRDIVDRLKDDPTVAGSESLADALPRVSPEKRDLLLSIRSTLDAVVDSATAAYTPNPFIYQGLVRKVDLLQGNIDRLKQFMEMKAQMAERAKQARQAQQNAPPQSNAPAPIDPSQLSPEQLAAMQNDPQMAAQMQARMQAQMEGGELPSRDRLPEGVQLPDGVQIPDGALIPEGMEIPEGVDVSQFAQGDALPEIPDISEEELVRIQKQIDRLKELTALLTGSQETVLARLQNANLELLERPRQALRTLAKLVSKGEPTPDVLPYLLKRMFIGKDGSYLVMAYPKDNIWETEPMEKFVGAMRGVDSMVTGTPIQVYESSLLMRDSFAYIGIYSLVAVALLVFFDFLSLRALFYVMFPLLLGVVWLVEIMGFFDVHLNLANFFAIPILIGIGVDNAVHLFHRYEENHNIEQTMYTTGTTLTLTTMTTITGFGSLIFASHKGLASLGALMAIGSATCWFSCVVFLPTLIKLTCRHHKARLEYQD